MLEIAGGLVLGAVGLWCLLLLFVALCALTVPKSKNTYTARPIDPRKMQKFMGM